MSIADMQRFAELRRGGDATLSARLALLRHHRAAVEQRIRALRANARELDNKIKYYETQLGDS